MLVTNAARKTLKGLIGPFKGPYLSIYLSISLSIYLSAGGLRPTRTRNLLLGPWEEKERQGREREEERSLRALQCPEEALKCVIRPLRTP